MGRQQDCPHGAREADYRSLLPLPSDRRLTAQLASWHASITWPRLAAIRTPGAGNGGGQHNVASSSVARRCRQARRERCGRTPAGSGTRSAVRCADRRNCSGHRRGATPALHWCRDVAGSTRPGGCALPPDGPDAAGCGRERPSSCAAPARFAGEGALRPRSAAASAVGMLCSAGGVGRGGGTVAWDPRLATDFSAEAAVPGAPTAGLALTGALPPQVSRPDGGAGSAATAEVPAPPIPRAGSSAGSAAGAGVLSPAIVPSGVGGTPGCCCAPRFAGEVAPPAGPSCAFGSGPWPAQRTNQRTLKAPI